MKRTLLLLGVLVLCANAPAQAADTRRAAKILTPELAQKALGCTVKGDNPVDHADTENGKAWVSKAYYYATDTSKGSAGLLIRHGASADEAANIFSSSKSTFNGVDVPGLGAPAYRTKTPAQLNVLKGSNWLIISCGKFVDADTAGQELIAKESLPKITD